MTVVIDADSCPVVGIAVEEAKKRNVPVVCVCDTSHVILDEYVKSIIVDKGRDSTDIAVVNICKEGDIVITQDYGVASMALARKSRCINQNGLCYTENNIDSLMAIRHIASTERRKSSKHHLKGPKKRTDEDDVSFRRAFVRLLEDI